MAIGKTYRTLREQIEGMDVIDTHEHQHSPAMQPRHEEPIAAFLSGYMPSDLQSAAGEKDAGVLTDPKVATEEKWPLFQRVWARTEFTGYAMAAKATFRNEYGVRLISLKAFKNLAGKLVDMRDKKTFDAALDRYRIRCMLANVLPDQVDNLLSPKFVMHERARFLIRLPELHNVRDYLSVQNIAGRVDRSVTCLDEYVEALREYCRRCKERGAVGMKDQSAYGRQIAFESGTRPEAEKLFGQIMDDPRAALGYPQARPLDDYLFHELMRIARDLDLPVQIHTGHMAGIRNDIAKTNASHFRGVLELHRQVRFDLFHGNWPFPGEWLFLGKNYPNVWLDCCWLHIIDPRYARRVLADSLVTVPHGKIFGFGGDVRHLEGVGGHLTIAKDNIAAALAEMVDDGWLGLSDARRVAADWLFNNANEFYRLGFEPIK